MSCLYTKYLGSYFAQVILSYSYFVLHPVENQRGLTGSTLFIFTALDGP